MAHRREHARLRVMSRLDLEYYCELIAAMKLLTTNKAGAICQLGVQYSCLKNVALKHISTSSGHLTAC